MRLLSGTRSAAWEGHRRTVVLVVALVVALLASAGALLAPGDLAAKVSGGGGTSTKKIKPAERGCWYPGVCFYKTKESWRKRFPTAVFVDLKLVQTLPTEQAVGSYAVLNSRHDDGALITLASKNTHCVKPGELYHPGNEVTKKIQILDSPSCRNGKGDEPADTTSAISGCRYPKICVYQTSSKWYAGEPTSSFDGDFPYQRLDSTSMAYALVNTRRDDIVIIRMLGGGYKCVEPRGHFTTVIHPEVKDPLKSATMSDLMIKNMSKCPAASELADTFFA